MDWTVIEQKLESLRRCLRRVQEKCPPAFLIGMLSEQISALP